MFMYLCTLPSLPSYYIVVFHYFFFKKNLIFTTFYRDGFLMDKQCLWCIYPIFSLFVQTFKSFKETKLTTFDVLFIYITIFHKS